MGIFKSKPKTSAPAPQTPLHPLQQLAMGFLARIHPETEMDALSTASVRSAAKICKSFMATMSPEQCNKLCAEINKANAWLCYATGTEPERYVNSIDSAAPVGQSAIIGNDGERQDDASALSVVAS